MPEPDKRPCIKLYPRSEEQSKYFHKLAKDKKAPLSPFLLNIIEEAVSTVPKIALRNDQNLRDLEVKCQDLQDSLDLKRLRIEQLEKEARSLRAKQWSKSYFAGVRQIDMALMELLRKGTFNQYRLLQALKINPSDQEQVQAISTQLEYLEGHGLIEKTGGGWRWKQ
jgi:hypothetical protein